jgi:hypothetical protein
MEQFHCCCQLLLLGLFPGPLAVIWPISDRKSNKVIKQMMFAFHPGFGDIDSVMDLVETTSKQYFGCTL